MMPTLSFKEKVYQIVARIPRGQTLMYQQVARLAGRPRAYRAVGNILNKNRDTKAVPCHRVIRSDGTVGGYAWGTKRKMALLMWERAVAVISKK